MSSSIKVSLMAAPSDPTGSGPAEPAPGAAPRGAAPLPATGPNAEQIEYWNSQAGSKWVTFQRLMDAQLDPLGLKAMDRAAIAAGERVIDVGCGCGSTTVEIAQRVGPSGAVLDVDISTVMLAQARQAARAAGLRQVRFENVDAQTHRFPSQSFDIVFSRFGVMFFAHPDDAFRNLHQALRPGGRLAFVCWQSLPQNPWLFVPLTAALPHIPPPPIPSPDAPGPFAFADSERVRGILSRAGFDDIGFESVNDTLTVGGGGGLDEAVEFLAQGVGPTARILRELDDATRTRVMQAVREALTPFVTPHGVRMPSAAWIVTARRP